MLNAERIKLKLPDIAGIEQLAFTEVGDRLVAAFNGITTSVAHNASEEQMVAAIRNAASLRTAQLRSPDDPAPVELSPQPLPTKGPAMTSFAASLKAVLDDARSRVAQAQTMGVAKVKEAADRLNEAAVQTQRVTDTMASQINEQADAVLAELGQISNLPPE